MFPRALSKRSLLSVASSFALALSLSPSMVFAQYSSVPVRQGYVVYVPAGMVMNARLATSVSSQVAQPGDAISATLTDAIHLGNGVIPAGSVLNGRITDAKPGQRLARSGLLGIKFTSLRTPWGAEVPITAHLMGDISKYASVGSPDLMKGEKLSNKVGSVAVQGAIGAGTGAALGTAIGAIAGRSGRSVGRGAWSGAAIGGGLGMANSLILRKGKDVLLSSGTPIQLQLDAPATVAMGSTGNF